jgi:tetratricopeptide (TPR) repeat protein
MLLRCTSRKYADDFITSGNLRFGKPCEWIRYGETHGHGRGDPAEGSFAAIFQKDSQTSDFLNCLRPNVTQRKFKNLIYFQSEDVINLRTYCLFGLNDNSFSEIHRAEDKRLYPVGYISKDFFSDFANHMTQKQIDQLPREKQPVLIMINNPHEFFERIKSVLMGMGIRLNEIIIRPVTYLNKKIQFTITNYPPTELFAKDEDFSSQQEIRIVIYTSRPEIIKKFNDCDGIINIGPLGDIASIEEYYYKDLCVELRGKELLYELPQPKIVQDSKERSMSFINQVLCNRLPQGCTKGNYTKEELISITAQRLKEKYHIDFDRKSLTFQADENYKSSGPDDWARQWILQNVDDILCGDGCALLEQREYDGAIQNFTDAIEINALRPDFWYDRGIAYYMMGQNEKAISDYSQAIKLNPNNAKYYFERAKTYNRLGLLENAKSDYINGIAAYGDVKSYSYKSNEQKKLLLDLALAAQVTEKYEIALVATSKCIELQYNIPESYNMQGNIYQSLNQIGQALDSYKIYLKKEGIPLTHI